MDDFDRHILNKLKEFYEKKPTVKTARAYFYWLVKTRQEISYELLDIIARQMRLAHSRPPLVDAASAGRRRRCL